MKQYSGGSKVEARFPCTFMTLDNEALSVWGLRIVLEDQASSGLPSCELTFETDAVLAERLLKEEHFSLLSGTTAYRPAFDNHAPVLIRLRLRQHLAKRLHDNKQDSEVVLRGLLGQVESLRVLQQTESWLALELMQEIALPGAAASEGRVRQGVQTHWAKAYPPHTDATSGRAHTIVADTVSDYDAGSALEAALAQLDLRFERVSAHILRSSFSTPAGITWRVLFHIAENTSWCSVYSVFPEPVPASAHPAVAVQLMSANYDSAAGAFELDAEDGELRYRTSLPLTSISADTLLALLQEHQRIMTAYLPLAADWKSLLS